MMTRSMQEEPVDYKQADGTFVDANKARWLYRQARGYETKLKPGRHVEISYDIGGSNSSSNNNSRRLELFSLLFYFIFFLSI
jgi:hypothetical protein